MSKLASGIFETQRQIATVVMKTTQSPI